MKNQGEKNQSKTPVSSIIMYVVAAVVGIIAISYLVINVKLYINSVAQYVAQGYPKAEVTKQLVPGQLLPGIFQPVALYGGISFILVCAGLINCKVSKCLNLLSNNASDLEVAEEIKNETETVVVPESDEENKNETEVVTEPEEENKNSSETQE